MIAEGLAYAKINLTLEIGAKREDGFHSLISVMARATLSDIVEVKKEGVGITISASLPEIENDENLAVRAAKGYFEASGIKPEGVRITLDKRIPLASGLGGGSADAATVIECMEKLFSPLDNKKRHSLARSLGADVPYCLEKSPALCTGIGDECEIIPKKDMKSLFLVIDKRDDKLSTGSVYSAFDALEKSELPYDHSGVIKALREGDASLLTKSLFNDFERVVLPRSAKTEALKREYLDKGALSALMSGAGPSIVGFFDDEKKAKSVSENVYKLL